MRRLTINGDSYAVPFVKLFRRHTDSELAGLRSDIAAKGIWSPVIVGVSPTHGRIIIDGATRAEIGHELEQEVPIIDVGEIDDADAESRARALNIHRRHLTTIELNQLIAACAPGKTQMQIAHELGVNQSSVSRALERLRQAEYATHIHEDVRNGSPAAAVAEREPRKAETPDDEAPPFTVTVPQAYIIAKMLKAVTTLENGAAELIGTPLEPALRAAARRTKYPMGRGDTLPILAAVRAMLEGIG